METIKSSIKMLFPQCFMVVLDLKDAYYHVPIHKDHQRFLRMAIHIKGVLRHFQFTALPFGLAIAPRVFTKLVAEVMAHLREENTLIVPYLDDFLVIGSSQQHCKNQLDLVIQSLKNLGWLINLEKSKLVPSQVQEYLGLTLDSRKMECRLPEGKLQKIKSLASRVQSLPSITLRQGISAEEDSGGRGVGHINCPVLAEETLVLMDEKDVDIRPLGIARPTGSVVTGPNLSSAGQELTLDSLALERKILESRGFSSGLISTLLKSRKPVTTKQYGKIWKKFLSVSGAKIGKEIPINAILEFLQNGLEMGLATSTLKVHVAALGALFNFDLASNRLYLSDQNSLWNESAGWQIRRAHCTCARHFGRWRRPGKKTDGPREARGANLFSAKINIEVQWASELAIAAVEKNGGVITTGFYDPRSLEMLVAAVVQAGCGSCCQRMPIPKRMLPPEDLVKYYTAAENRGYLADPAEVVEARRHLAKKYGYVPPDITKDELYEMLCTRKDPRQIFFGLAPGWVVNMKEKKILKPTDERLLTYYSS
ncbi:unnamed protein product [Ranitomeya imitator]|uniref:ribonuclease H n=1 Tax=Ranitomeya imitator TaxID=111125 RepID=A0ABN9LQE7_9NEOB|nr:unnamed protein product [Ranitomeya imitator]